MASEHQSEYREKIDPKDCLIRLCRFCLSPMNLIEYEFDSDNRWYTFCCIKCKHQTALSEPIFDGFMVLNDIEHEPLTFAEQKIQRIEKEMENNQHYFSNHFQEDNR